MMVLRMQAPVATKPSKDTEAGKKDDDKPSKPESTGGAWNPFKGKSQVLLASLLQI